MLDIKQLTTKVKGAMKAFMEWNNNDTNDCSVVIDTDFKHDIFEKNGAFWDSDLSTSQSEEELSEAYLMEDEDVQSLSLVKEEVEAAITDSCLKDQHCQLLVPQALISRVSEDIVRMSLSEPCGIHGCAIYIVVQEKGRSYPLNTIYGNTSTPPTFEIHLTLKEDTGGLRKLQKAFFQVKGFILNNDLSRRVPKIVQSTYQLEKRKLYRNVNSCENVKKSFKV